MLRLFAFATCTALITSAGALAATAAQKAAPAVVQAGFPDEVNAFLRDRELCDHFRGEPIEGSGPEAEKRRAFVLESLEIYCSGTDRRLAALKRRFADAPEIMSVLQGLETPIEPSCKHPADVP